MGKTVFPTKEDVKFLIKKIAKLAAADEKKGAVTVTIDKDLTKQALSDADILGNYTVVYMDVRCLLPGSQIRPVHIIYSMYTHMIHIVCIYILINFAVVFIPVFLPPPFPSFPFIPSSVL